MVIGKIAPFRPGQDDFEAWIEVVDSYLLANDIDKTKTPEKAAAILISCIGLPSYTLLKSLIAPKDPAKEKFENIVHVLLSHYKPAPKALAERYKFYCRRQHPGETANVFLSELRTLAVTCKFGDLNTALRDQFIFGLSSEASQKRIFLEDDNVKLDKVVSIAVSQEQADVGAQVIRSGLPVVPTSVDRVSMGKGKSQPHRKSQPSRRNQSNQVSNGKHQQSCPNCGNSHSKSECPHRSVQCHNCKKKGHFAKYCKSAPTSQQHSSINTVKCLRKATQRILLKIQLNNHPMSIELDTGSDATFLSLTDYRRVGSPKLTKSVSFKTYTDQVFQSKGQFIATIRHNDQVRKLRVEVCENSSLLGRDFLNLFQVDWSEVKSQCGQVNKVQPSSELEELLHEYRDVFDKPVGRIKHFEAKIVLKDDAVPKFCKARPVPFAIRPLVDAKLDTLEKMGAIERVETSEWASPLVVVPQGPGKVRVTGDFKNTVNNQLCVTQYPLARVEDLLESVAGGSTFSKMDATEGFHQVPVEESCRKFLVINTHRGLYRYNVLPMGIASSPAIFQEMMDTMLRDVPMCGSYVDDTILSAKDDSRHLQNLRKAFQKMREWNFRLSRAKSVFMKSQVEFLGQIICHDGIRTHPKNVEAITSMSQPRDCSQVKSFLGLVNFYAKFVPNLSQSCEPLYKLTRDNVQFKWTKECESAFQDVKHAISSAPVLAHFQQSLPVGLSCDASSVGLGVVLFHKYPDGSERPIAFASKTLSSSERNYSQIEKEGLSIVFGVKRFFQFLYGRQFLLVTDHQPLLAIFGSKSGLPSLVASRLHHWAWYLSGFQFQVIYRNTNLHGNADALSRLPMACNQPADQQTDLFVKNVREDHPVLSKNVKFFTSRDPVLSKVTRFVQSGWPERPNLVPETVQPFFPHRHEFSLEDGTLMWGIRVVVPEKLKPQVLNQLHETHPGVVRMKSLARQAVWWPGIDKQIEAVVKSCTECCLHQNSPAVAPTHPWAFPEKPWQRLHVDLAGPFCSNMWLICVDAHSKWPEVFNLGHNTTSHRVICCLREVFSRFGLPETIVSDNGPQFTSQEFATFCRSNGIRHSTSSPYHPRSNGQAERFVKTFKQSVGKGKNNDVNVSLCSFLLTYRCTPHATTGVSPYESLLKLKPRTKMDLLKPDPNARVRQQQENIVQRSAVCARRFNPGDTVWVQMYVKTAPKWSLGSVVRAVGPVSYIVKVDNREMKRHIDQLISAAAVPFVSSPDPPSPKTPPTSSPFRHSPSVVKPEPTSPSTPLGSPEFSSATTSPVISKDSPVNNEDSDSSVNVRPQRVRTQPQRLMYH